MLGGGDGGGASVAVLVSSCQEGGGGNAASHDPSNNSGLAGVFGEEEINNARNGNSMEDGDRNSGGNHRWPRQETLALLKIRSDMDVAFRDSNLKGPLWDDVSRKMAELGYHRSAKKCKEKFENVYKYHKRTKDGRSSKSDGKTYRFFDQLEALDQLQPFQVPPPVQQQQKVSSQLKAPPFPMQPPPAQLALQIPTTTTISFSQQLPCRNSDINNPITAAPITPAPTNPTTIISPHLQCTATNFMLSTSSSTSSDDFQQRRRTEKKRKWKDFFEKLMRDVVDKQEELQNKFLRTIEMRERDRSMREEAWRMQEMARLNREHDILVQERSAAAAKDAAIIAFLQKIAGQQQLQTQPQQPPPPQPKPQPAPHTIIQLDPTTTPPPPQPQPQPQPKPLSFMKPDSNASGDQNNLTMVCGSTPPSSSRWPKAEVEALIKLRTRFEIKYQENGPKGPFWEEISAGMSNLGYNRNAKRCKEKWENINKYFKKVKESNKQRPQVSKTCPYYHLLDAIYKEKKGGGGDNDNFLPPPSANFSMEPLMVQPEQQWPLAPQAQARHNEDEEQDDMLDEDELDQDMEDEGEDGEEENNGGTYEVVATASNKAQHGASAATGSLGTAAVA